VILVTELPKNAAGKILKRELTIPARDPAIMVMFLH
jgi:acyl-coenzyme A synthetase/AMP-(fatty) acid ligase